MKVASMDLGSNSFLLLIVELEGRKIKTVIHDEVQITRLGRGVQKSNRLSVEALSSAESCFKKFAKTISDIGVDRIVATATSAARDAVNSSEFIELGRQFGFSIQIISGQKEAELSFFGATYHLESIENISIIDIGGGSTEFLKKTDAVIQGESVNIGAVRLLEMFGEVDPMPEKQQHKMRAYIRFQLGQALKDHKKGGDIVAVAGTPTALACVVQEKSFSAAQVDGFKLDQRDLQEWSEKLLNMSVAQKKKLPGLDSKRADIIAVGATILSEALRFLEGSEVVVSTRGVRFGSAILYDQITS